MIRAVVVEDSAVQRAHLVRTLEAEGDIRVVGEATDAGEAIELVARLQPDVVTVDLQIPGGGGQSVIERVMAIAPTPMLVLSAGVADRDSSAAIGALLAGAVDVLPKPRTWNAEHERALRERVRLVRGVTVLRHPRGGRPERAVGTLPTAGRAAGVPIVGVAASTGGPAALAVVLAGLAGLRAAVLVVQHLHPDFVSGLVTWMARESALPVELAEAGRPIVAGTVLIAPGEKHLKVGRDDIVVLDPLPETIHRPSADVLFNSLATRPAPAVGVILTGMGDDGASGLLAMRQAGHRTIAQDEATSAVFGMPRSAQRLGAAGVVAPLGGVAKAILQAASS